MANLLSVEQLRIRRAEYTNRILTGSFVIIMSASLIAFLAILPAYILIRSERVSLESQNQAIAESVSASQSNSDRDDLIDTRQRIEVIDKTLNSSGVALQIVRSLVELRPEDLYIQSIQYTAGKRDTTRISGVVESRARIQEYISSLNTSGLFDSVSVPVSALADAADGIFVITASGGTDL